MPDEVRTTTRPPPPTRPEATSDTGRSVLVVVDPTVVPGLLPAERQALAAASGLPSTALSRLAAAGVPVVVGGSTNTRAAMSVASARSASLGLQTRVLAGPGPSRLLASVGALLVAAASLVMVPLVGAGAWVASSTAWWALLPLALTATLGFVGVRGLIRAFQDAQAPAVARREHGAAIALTRAAPDAWAALFALREASLAPDVPAAVQADLWTSLDAAEAALERGDDVAGWTAALREARIALKGPDPAQGVEARAHLHQVARRARAAIDEAQRP